MSEAPEKIWTWTDHGLFEVSCSAEKAGDPASGTEYIRADRIEDLERKVAELEADQKEARGWARSWHQVCQTIATILDLPEPEGETFAQAVSDKWRDYVPADHYASANHARNAAEADKARLSEALRTLLDCPDIADNDYKDEETHTAERVARAALSGSGSGWRDIASAPHDGTVVLVCSADAQSPRVQAAWWHDGWWRSYKPTLDKFETENPFRWFPTHWMPMPLPAAPQQGGE